MTWQPFYKTANRRQIAANLLAFVKANQADALAWASPAEALKPLIEFSDSVANRNSPNLPSLAFADDDDATDYAQDLIQSAYRVNFEAMAANGDPNAVVRQARLYAYALESLILNAPKEDLLFETGINDFILQTIETGFEQIRTNPQRTSFLQMFQIRATYTLVASSYE